MQWNITQLFKIKFAKKLMKFDKIADWNNSEPERQMSHFVFVCGSYS